MRRGRALFGGGLAVAALLGASPASAQITIAGSTAGCFSMSATLAGTCESSLGSSVLGLTFTGTSFTTTSSALDGTWALGSNVNPARTLGAFTLATTTADYNSYFFHLFVTVTSPAGTTPSLYEFVGDVSGSVTNGSGDVAIEYDAIAGIPNSGIGSFPGGGFGIEAPNTPVTAGETANQHGFGKVNVAPEPMSLLLLGTGLAGVGTARRRRKAQRQA